MIWFSNQNRSHLWIQSISPPHVTGVAKRADFLRGVAEERGAKYGDVLGKNNEDLSYDWRIRYLVLFYDGTCFTTGEAPSLVLWRDLFYDWRSTQSCFMTGEAPSLVLWRDLFYDWRSTQSCFMTGEAPSLVLWRDLFCDWRSTI